MSATTTNSDAFNCEIKWGTLRKREYNSAIFPSSRTQELAFSQIERHITRVDEKINRREYVLYGLSEEEIKIVEGKE